MSRLRVVPTAVGLALASGLVALATAPRARAAPLAVPAAGRPGPGDDRASAAPPRDKTVVGLALEGEEAEEFLRTARVVERKKIGKGITRPLRLTLTDGVRTLRAAFKTIDEHQFGMTRMEAGGYEFDFRDSWKNEVAAYELSKLLGLGLVPPTVEREVDGHRGSAQMWVEQAVTEKERQKQGLKPEHVARWTQAIYCVRLFHQLTYNADFRNVENVLVDKAFRVYVIDSSRAFRIQKDLLAPDDLQAFSRRALEHLDGLDRGTLEERLGRWLDGMQIDALLARRDRIDTLVKVRLVKFGPGQVLFY